MSIPVTRYWQLLSGYLAPQRRRVVLLFVLILAGIGFQVGTPQLIATFIDEALGSAGQSRLMLLAAVFIAAALLPQLLAVASTYVSETVGWTATNALRVDMAAQGPAIQPGAGFYLSEQHRPRDRSGLGDGSVAIGERRHYRWRLRSVRLLHGAGV